jgi:prepilin-type N-terminal cleavage/methylation domain-containing protein
MKINRHGITLTEMVVTVFILGLLSTVAGTFLIGGTKIFRLDSAKGEIQRDARLSIDLINRNLRQSKADTVSVSRYNSSQPPCSMIEFTHVNGNEYKFYQLNSSFYLSEKKASSLTWHDSKIAGNLRNLIFTYPRLDDETIISVSLCFEKATYDGATKALQLSVEKVRIMN